MFSVFLLLALAEGSLVRRASVVRRAQVETEAFETSWNGEAEQAGLLPTWGALRTTGRDLVARMALGPHQAHGAPTAAELQAFADEVTAVAQGPAKATEDAREAVLAVEAALGELREAAAAHEAAGLAAAVPALEAAERSAQAAGEAAQNEALELIEDRLARLESHDAVHQLQQFGGRVGDKLSALGDRLGAAWEDLEERGDALVAKLDAKGAAAVAATGAAAAAAKVELEEFAQDVAAFTEATKQKVHTGSAAAKAQAKKTLLAMETRLAALTAAAKEKGGEIADAVPTLEEVKAGAQGVLDSLQQFGEAVGDHFEAAFASIQAHGDALSAKLSAHGATVRTQSKAALHATKLELDEFAEECRQFAAETKENAKTASAAAKAHAKETLAKMEAKLAALAAAAKQKGGEIADAVPTLEEVKAGAHSAWESIQDFGEAVGDRIDAAFDDLQAKGDKLSFRLKSGAAITKAQLQEFAEEARQLAVATHTRVQDGTAAAKAEAKASLEALEARLSALAAAAKAKGGELADAVPTLDEIKKRTLSVVYSLQDFGEDVGNRFEAAFIDLQAQSDALALRLHAHGEHAAAVTKAELEEFAASVRAFAATARERGAAAGARAQRNATRFGTYMLDTSPRGHVEALGAGLSALAAAAKAKGGEMADAVPTLEEVRAGAQDVVDGLQDQFAGFHDAIAEEFGELAEKAGELADRVRDHIAPKVAATKAELDDFAVAVREVADASVQTVKDSTHEAKQDALEALAAVEEKLDELEAAIVAAGGDIVDAVPTVEEAKQHVHAAATSVQEAADEAADDFAQLMDEGFISNECCECKAKKFIGFSFGRTLTEGSEFVECDVGCGFGCDSKMSVRHFGEIWDCEPAADQGKCAEDFADSN